MGGGEKQREGRLRAYLEYHIETLISPVAYIILETLISPHIYCYILIAYYSTALHFTNRCYAYAIAMLMFILETLIFPHIY